MIQKQITPIEGLFVLSNTIFSDDRGLFKKLFSKDDFHKIHLEHDFKELYYSVNKKNVIRGMHFQLPPYDHVKIVYVIQGTITDVCLDIRKNSKTYGKIFSIELCGRDDTYLYIPKGIAHGFASREDTSIVHYVQTSCYSKEHDCGIRYDSFGFDWHIENPIISSRDDVFPSMDYYKGIF